MDRNREVDPAEVERCHEALKPGAMELADRRAAEVVHAEIGPDMTSRHWVIR